ncbi:MAG: hypothetical protein H0X70_00120 [Segetibacter sp.]|jgi:hypothetical protein|nr:hypothetical protein [Segetibacter sp.]
MEYLQINMQLQPGDDDLELTEQASNDAVEEDGTPVLDQQDLKENNLTEEEAEQIVWDEPKES